MAALVNFYWLLNPPTLLCSKVHFRHTPYSQGCLEFHDLFEQRCHLCTAVHRIGQIFEKGYLSNVPQKFEGEKRGSESPTNLLLRPSQPISFTLLRIFDSHTSSTRSPLCFHPSRASVKRPVKIKLLHRLRS